jgi:hypothetical protein
MTADARRFTLTERDRVALAKPTIRKTDRESVPDLWEPFRDTYLSRVRPADCTHQFLWRAFRFCARMMLALDCTYWAFTWDRLLRWREDEKAGAVDCPEIWHRQWGQCWTEVTATVFFLDILPYRETIYRLLARHGWRKVMPRPQHPGRDPAAQAAFKGGSLRNSPASSPRRGRGARSA